MEDRPCALSGSPSPRHERAAIAARRRGAGVRLAAAIARGSLPILSRFDPELAHDVGLAGLQWLRPLGPLRGAPGGCSSLCASGSPSPIRLGLAAGFDKNGDYLDALGALGFSHIELGTVTPRPQPGNPKPRMFRRPAAQRWSTAWGSTIRASIISSRSSQRSRYRGIRGISIGKNADTPIERAADDYVDVPAQGVSARRLRRGQCLLAQHRAPARAAGSGRAGTDPRGRSSRRGPRSQRTARPKQRSAAGQDRPRSRRGPDRGASPPIVRSLGIDGVIATNTTTDLAAAGRRRGRPSAAAGFRAAHRCMPGRWP